MKEYRCENCKNIKSSHGKLCKSCYLNSLKTNNPFKGKHHTAEIRQKLSLLRKGKKLPPRTEEHCRKISLANKGFKARLGQKNSLEHNLKIGMANKGNRPNLGKKFPIEVNRRKGRRLEAHHAWKGGVSFEPYTIEFTKKLKFEIRTRDDFRCKICDKSEEQELSDLKKVLTVHHIDYNKYNCDKMNLITLCGSCNSKVNFNREHWTNKLQEVVNALH